MSDHTYKLVEVVGSSKQSTDDAIANAITKVSQTVNNLDWFEVVSTRGHIVDNKVSHYQVTLKIGFRVD